MLKNKNKNESEKSVLDRAVGQRIAIVVGGRHG
jgi:hypothetical protein